MKVLKPCSICRKEIAKNNCILCGLQVCDNCYNKEKHICKNCEEGKR